jgi:hypothetical protein
MLMSSQEEGDGFGSEEWPRGRFIGFMAAVESGISIQRLFLIIFGVAILSLAALLWKADNALIKVVRNTPVMVIPGARSGLYTPGISADNVKNLALYMIQLPLNITPKTVGDRYKEFERFLNPGELMKFQKEKPRILASIHMHDESRVFVASTYTLKTVGDNRYRFIADGVYQIFSGDLTLGSPTERVTMDFSVEDSATPHNPYGVQITNFHVAKQGAQ